MTVAGNNLVQSIVAAGSQSTAADGEGDKKIVTVEVYVLPS